MRDDVPFPVCARPALWRHPESAPMSDRVRVSVRRPYSAPRSPWHLDVAAGTLLLAGLLVALCVFSYDPADAPGTSVAPVNDRPANLLGSPGVHVAHALVGSLGLA